jgi:hypothetical protein
MGYYLGSRRRHRQSLSLLESLDICPELDSPGLDLILLVSQLSWPEGAEGPPATCVLISWDMSGQAIVEVNSPAARETIGSLGSRTLKGVSSGGLAALIVGTAVRTEVNDPTIFDESTTAHHCVGLVPVGETGEVDTAAELDIVRAGCCHL